MRLISELDTEASKAWERVRAETQYVMCFQLGLVRGMKESLRHCLRIRFGPASGAEARINTIDDPEILRHIFYAIEFAPDAQSLWDLLSLLDQRHTRHD